MKFAKASHRVGLAVCLVGLVVLAGSAAAQGPRIPTSLGAGSSVWLDGTSTMHDYESRTTAMKLTLERDAASTDPADAHALEALVRGSHVTSLDLQVPVKTLVSEKSGLDKNLWKALDADKYPDIRFVMSRYSILPHEAVGDTMALKAEGMLTIAGQERPDTLMGRAWRSDKGLWLEGSQKLLMTHFGIKPPKMMLGMLKVADEITVHFRLLIQPGEAKSTATATERK
jgi:polyisoprenoid-binding protein YceI